MLSSYHHELKLLDEPLRRARVLRNLKRPTHITNDERLRITVNIAQLHLQHNNPHLAMDIWLQFQQDGGTYHSLSQQLLVETFETLGEAYHASKSYLFAYDYFRKATSHALLIEQCDTLTGSACVVLTNLYYKFGSCVVELVQHTRPHKNEKTIEAHKLATQYLEKALFFWKKYQESELSQHVPAFEKHSKLGAIYAKLGKVGSLLRTENDQLFEYLNKAQEYLEQALQSNPSLSSQEAYPVLEIPSELNLKARFLATQELVEVYYHLITEYENRGQHVACIEVASKFITFEYNYEQRLVAYKVIARCSRFLHENKQLNNDQLVEAALNVVNHLAPLKAIKPYDFAEANYEMIQTYSQVNNFVLAIYYCDVTLDCCTTMTQSVGQSTEQVERIDQMTRNLRIAKAEMLLSLKQPQEAQKIYDQLFKDKQNQTGPNYEKQGFCYLELNRKNDAVGAFRKALQHYGTPNEREEIFSCISIRYQLAIRSKQMEQFPEMEKQLKNILKLFQILNSQGITNYVGISNRNFNANQIIAHSNLLLANYYTTIKVSKNVTARPSSRGACDEGSPVLEMAKNIKSYFLAGLQEPIYQTPLNYIDYSNYLLSSDNTREAIQSFQDIKSKFETLLDPLLTGYCGFTLGRLLLKENHLDAAIESLLWALTKDQTKTQLESIPQYIKKPPSVEGIHQSLGEIYYRQEKWTLALGHFQKSQVDHANTLYNQAICYLKLEELENAYQSICKAATALNEKPDQALSMESINTIKAQIIHVRGITLPALAKLIFDELAQYYDDKCIRLSGSSIFRLIEAQALIKNQDIDFSIKSQPRHEIAEKLHYRACLQNPYLYQKRTEEGFSIDCFFKSDNSSLGFLTINNVSCNAKGEFDQDSIRGIEDFFNKRLVAMSANPKEELERDPAFFFHLFKHPSFKLDPALERALYEHNKPIEPHKTAHLCASANKLLKNPITRDHVIDALYQYDLYSKLFGISRNLSKTEAHNQLNALIKEHCSNRSPRNNGPTFWKLDSNPVPNDAQYYRDTRGNSAFDNQEVYRIKT